MNNSGILWLVLSLLVAAGIVMSGGREKFGYTPEFIDHTMDAVTRQGEVSSYVQKTNQLRAPDSGRPPKGTRTGHRVGQFEAYTAPF